MVVERRMRRSRKRMNQLRLPVGRTLRPKPGTSLSQRIEVFEGSFRRA